MRKLLFVLLAASVLSVAGCAPGSYLDRLGNALIDRTGGLASDISADPSPLGIGSAVFKWVAGSLAVAGAGAGSVYGVKRTRRRRRAAAAAVIPMPEPLPPSPVDPPLLP